MSDKKANHICKNIHCQNGTDGNPKHYWACEDCDKMNSWRSVACSPECYQFYIQQVTLSRTTTTEPIANTISLESTFNNQDNQYVEPANGCVSAPDSGYSVDNRQSFTNKRNKIK